MQQPINPLENPTTYFVNPDEEAELARLLDVDSATTREMGIFPADYSLAAGSYVLDLACGPGGWACKVAEAYPESEVIGIDISQKMMRYARAQAQAQRLDNASFQVGNILQPLEFPDDAFDFVNARLISSFMPVDAWPTFVNECLRITRPGGTIRLTEAEWMFTNGRASEHFADLVTRAMWQDGKSFAPDGKRFGATLQLLHFLAAAGLINLKKHAYYIDYSYGTEQHETWYKQTLLMYPRLAPLLIKTGVATRQEIEQICEQISIEMQEPDFRGGLFFLSVWGMKPEAK